MTGSSRPLTLLLLAGALLGAAGPRDAGDPLKLRLVFDHSVYEVGQPIVYLVVLENTSSTTVEDVPPIDTDANGFALVVKREGDARPLARVGLFRDLIPTGSGILLGPGQCLTASDDLLHQYGERPGGKVDPRLAALFVLPPGRYQVRCSFTTSTGLPPGARTSGASSEDVWITVRDEGPREFTAAYAESIWGAIADRTAFGAALREQVNTSAYWYLLEFARGTLSRGQLDEILNAVEGEGDSVRRAIIMDQALAGGALNDTTEILEMAGHLEGPTRALERCVASSWEARYAQGFRAAPRLRE